MIRKLIALVAFCSLPVAAGCYIDADDDGGLDCVAECTNDHDDCVKACNGDGTCVKACDDNESQCVDGCG